MDLQAQTQDITSSVESPGVFMTRDTSTSRTPPPPCNSNEQKQDFQTMLQDVVSKVLSKEALHLILLRITVKVTCLQQLS